ncbi:lysophospholipase [Streptomyces sp. LP05-1]|uniref:Lysophospholipase n=1 Tax=Streptomyces pyxinae TaxID=2970734 RepID=A0ABT2CP06_9ACTN|nr:lysophospholipase [Streptomyces sp. LP05-1]MCS0639159.1 lysophospholipase [Streptomyces sp. LP05-1]
MATHTPATIRTLDGLHLAATLTLPPTRPSQAVVLVHGGGVTREEGGFFTRLADGLAESGIAALRFDLRGHGESEGRQEELTLATILNDVRVALAHTRETTGAAELTLLGASFGGGICAHYAAERPQDLTRLVLFNPQLDYKWRTIDSRPYWTDDTISEDAARELTEQGALRFTPTLRHGRPLLNEVFWLRPHESLSAVRAPTLIVHGTADTLVLFESSRTATARFTAPCRLVPVDGAQHGFAAHDDPQYLTPTSRHYQSFVIRTVTEWLTD